MKSIKSLVILVCSFMFVALTFGCSAQQIPANKQAGDWQMLEVSTYNRLATAVLKDKPRDAKLWGQTIELEQKAEVREITEVIPARQGSAQHLTKVEFERALDDAQKVCGWFNWTQKSQVRALENRWRKATSVEEAQDAISGLKLVTNRRYNEVANNATNSWTGKVFVWQTSATKDEAKLRAFEAALAAEQKKK